MLTIANIFQQNVNNRIKQWSHSQPEGGLTGQSAYGGIKGRCRLLLVWTLNAQSLELPQHCSHYIATGDFDSAYLSTDKDVQTSTFTAKALQASLATWQKDRNQHRSSNQHQWLLIQKTNPKTRIRTRRHHQLRPFHLDHRPFLRRTEKLQNRHAHKQSLHPTASFC